LGPAHVLTPTAGGEDPRTIGAGRGIIRGPLATTPIVDKSRMPTDTNSPRPTGSFTKRKARPLRKHGPPLLE
jgi:hypothetical protein